MKINRQLLMAALIAMLTLTACSDDDDNNGGGTSDYDEEFTASHADIRLYADWYAEGLDCYSVMLSDKELDEYGYTVVNSKTYRMALLTEPRDDADGAPSLREGTYRLDTTDSKAPWTIDPYYCDKCVTDADRADQLIAFTDATVTVKREADGNYVIDLVGTDETGLTHHACYRGKGDVTDERGLSHEPTSRLTGDYRLDFDGITVELVYAGHYYSDATDQWVIYMWPADYAEGDYLTMFVSTPTRDGLVADDITGRFTAGGGQYPDYLCEAGTFQPGVKYNGYVQGSEYYYYGTWNGPAPQANLTGGAIEISRNAADGTHTIDVDCTDDYGHRVYGTWTGEATVRPAHTFTE